MTYSMLLFTSLAVFFFYLFILLFKYLILNPLRMFGDYLYLRRCPIKTGQILQVKNLFKQGNRTKLKTEIEFENLSNTSIVQTINFFDEFPDKEKFQPGNTIDLRVNIDPRSSAWVYPDQATFQLNKRALLICVSIVGAYLYGVYSAIMWVWEGIGEQLTPKLEQIIQNTLIFYVMGGCLLAKLFIDFIFSNKMSIETIQALTRYGLSTTAEVIEVKGTGMKIDGQAVVDLLYRFQDQQGNWINGNARKLLDKKYDQELSNIKQQEILYLPNDSSTSCIEDDIRSISQTYPVLRLMFNFILLIIFIGVMIVSFQEILKQFAVG
jgi:hypothetical protein